jgi:hypothetical protein
MIEYIVQAASRLHTVQTGEHPIFSSLSYMFSDVKVLNTSTIADSTSSENASTTGTFNTVSNATEIGGEDAQTALKDGGVVVADPPTANTSLGLDVQCVLFPPLSIAFLRPIHA